MWVKLLLFIAGFLVSPSAAESPGCLAVYRAGGAPAVFQSPKCPRWTLLPEDVLRRTPPPGACHVATHQGRRSSQEDRTVCVLDMRIPFLGRTGVKEMSVGLVAVFDGHNGAEASHMASKLLLDYFLLHVYFLLDGIYSVMLKKSDKRLTYGGEENMILQELNLGKGKSSHNFNPERMKWISSTIFDRQFHMEILKESLLRTIHDIDATFSNEAFRQNLESGSTAVVVLIADGQILAANIGDSKALLCSEIIHPHNKKAGNVSNLNRRRRHKRITSPVKKLVESDGTSFVVKELTEDHHPGRDDERNRVEAAGGYVVEWAGVVRVNGALAVSRAIGDISFKNYGVISTPEVTDWQYMTSNDSYLVVASDGIFEKMTTQDVCDLLLDESLRIKSNPNFITTITHSLADCIVRGALQRGSMDNMAAVVVPLRCTGFLGTNSKDECDKEGSFGSSPYGPTKTIYEKSDDYATTTSLISVEFFKKIISRFNRLLVETEYKRLGCFYLSENLNDDMDYVFQAHKDDGKDGIHNISNALPEPLESSHGDNGQCTGPEVFAKFLGLLDSIPYNETASNSSQSFGHKNADFRYILKRRFDRGSYGEVWLAFHWNCSQDDDIENQMRKNPTSFASNLKFNRYKRNMRTDSSDKDCSTDPNESNLFILKRIMVERGNAAYLSGLREKYFGETFLNASLAHGSLTVSKLSSTFPEGTQLDLSDLLPMNLSAIDVEHVFNPMSMFPGHSRKFSISYEEGLKHIARYVESFESESKEIWLVFRNEGISLSKLIYTADNTKLVTNDERDERARNIQLLHPSAWWHWLRTTEAGEKELQNIILQLLMALKSCHDRNITHRDIKPENMIICFEDVATGRCSREIPSGQMQYHLKMRIIDFGSAIDDFTMKHLYGSGPARSEQTFEYTPPEALLNASWFHGPRSVRLKYDMWSVGVVMLELILGSPHVFQISDRTRVLLDQRLEGWSEHMKELAYKLRSYMEMCILIPGISPQQHHRGGRKDLDGVWPASWKCSEEYFSNRVKSRDPLGLGFVNVWALRLVRQLLMWHPEDRLSIDDALHHPYFRKHPQTRAHGED